jgi:cellulose biosynthesis protein BcsQ
MSKVLFWAPYHGQGQTCNIQVTALIMGLVYRKRILLMQTHFMNNNLEGPLVGYNVDNESDESEIFYGIGLDMAVTYSNMKKIDIKLLESCCLTFPNTPIYLLPGTQTKCRETFDRDIARSATRLIQDADECVDLVFIDANSGNDALSVKMMDLSDLIVINLTQRRYVIKKFFEDYGERFIDNAKVFYLFGDYDDNSSYNINNCRRKYGKYIKANNSGVIPYCTKFMDAQNEGNIIRFIKNGLTVRSKDKENKLINQIIMRFHSGIRSYGQEETDYFFHKSCRSVEKMVSLL